MVQVLIDNAMQQRRRAAGAADEKRLTVFTGNQEILTEHQSGRLAQRLHNRGRHRTGAAPLDSWTRFVAQQ